MSGMLDYVAEAIRLLRDQADAVHESHNAPGETTFEGEPEAEAAYAELERVANGLETEIAARLRGDAAQPAAPAPVAGDAVRNAASALLEKLLSIHGSSEYQAVWQIAQLHRGPYTGPKYDEEMAALKAALAQDRASQGAAPSAPVGDDRWKALIVQWQRRAEAVGYDGVEDALDAAIAAKSAPVAVPDGWRLVPDEAIRQALVTHVPRVTDKKVETIIRYIRKLAAAPQPDHSESPRHD